LAAVIVPSPVLIESVLYYWREGRNLPVDPGVYSVLGNQKPLPLVNFTMSSPYGGRPKISNAGGGGGGMSADDAEQDAAERNLIRRCVDYHGPAVIDLQNRLYRKACRSHHTRQSSVYLQPHSSYLRLMGMPISQVAAPIASEYYLTYMAHVTRAKNSSAVMCLSWTPGGRRLLTGNQEGEFTL
jgi:hypothetical protein